ncbi:unnamed protein product [Clonostachys rosea f. rosea IK726]|uniref:Uncharacterized protein n=1 Tax=Clonostachys rosea f. rosea IK726 TaxID=1349383 RepID=A0ACA9USA3_BIOOC|nr:unnamed protein product [Clonostachys rosea f. rosea IK726]
MGGLRPSRRGLCTQQGLKRQASPETPYHTFRYDTSEDFETEGAYDGKPSALKGRASPVSQDDDYRAEPSTALNRQASPEYQYDEYRSETSKDRTILPNGQIPKCPTDCKFDCLGTKEMELIWPRRNPLNGVVLFTQPSHFSSAENKHLPLSGSKATLSLMNDSVWIWS